MLPLKSTMSAGYGDFFKGQQQSLSSLKKVEPPHPWRRIRDDEKGTRPVHRLWQRKS